MFGMMILGLGSNIEKIKIFDYFSFQIEFRIFILFKIGFIKKYVRKFNSILQNCLCLIKKNRGNI